VYDRKYYPVKLEKWIRGMEKTFTMMEIPYEKKGEHWNILSN